VQDQQVAGLVEAQKADLDAGIGAPIAIEEGHAVGGELNLAA
jgi:hypothetical protein